MEREEGSSCGGGGNNGEWVRACDSCRSDPCLVYCRADAAYLCAACDARVHAANRVASRHDRVWVCEVCERAPAAFTCRADAATLCATCDADVHAANPLASRHHRVAVRPIPPGVLPAGGRAPPCSAPHEAEEAAASWVFVNSARADGDEYLDLAENKEIGDYLPRKKEIGDCLEKEKVEDHLVPIECLVPNEQQIQEGQQYFPMEMEYEASDAGFSFAPSYGHNVSLSSVEVSVVPDTSNMTENSSTQIQVSNGTIDLFSSPPIQIPTQFSAMDREARVMRYREKRKARKFEKTIRYASRKAYAETRPRIKGRFAKRSDIELEVDEMFATSMMSEGSYGIVPSF